MQLQRKRMIQTQEKDKNLILAWFTPVGPKFGPPFFFPKVWLCKSLDIMVSYHRVQYQENLAIQSWEKLVTDGQTGGGTDGQMDRQMDEHDFIGRWLSNESDD